MSSQANGNFINFSHILLKAPKFTRVEIGEGCTIADLLKKKGIIFDANRHLVIHPAPVGGAQKCNPQDRITAVFTGDYLIVVEIPREMALLPLET